MNKDVVICEKTLKSSSLGIKERQLKLDKLTPKKGLYKIISISDPVQSLNCQHTTEDMYLNGVEHTTNAYLELIHKPKTNFFSAAGLVLEVRFYTHGTNNMCCVVKLNSKYGYHIAKGLNGYSKAHERLCERNSLSDAFKNLGVMCFSYEVETMLKRVLNEVCEAQSFYVNTLYV